MTTDARAAMLEVRGLSTVIEHSGQRLPVVSDVGFSVAAGETVAIVGESGCGKSMTALSLLRIHPEPPARIVAGEVWLEGEPLHRLSEAQMQRVRGARAAMIFQEPMTSLNPVMTIGDQIIEAIATHRDAPYARARADALELLRRVNIADAERRIDEYPHRLSGGMRQRAMIAMALACRPRLLIADEPTTALDVTIQAQILELIRALQRETAMAVVLITHDLGVVAEYAQRVVVMYAGRVVEQATTREIFARPRHPYTQGLLAATPRFGAAPPPRHQRMTEIPGMVPALSDLPAGCAFEPRCPHAHDRCRSEIPQLAPIGAARSVACFATLEAAGAG